MAKKVPLSNGQFAIVDDDDYEVISKFNWHDVSGYAGTTVRMHRLILNAANGSVVDHINGDPLDNRKCNLRICTHAQNQQNTRSRGGSSRYKGVSFNKRYSKWLAAFMFEGQYYYCGYWQTEEEAARAVDKKRGEVCGDFACKNLENLD